MWRVSSQDLGRSGAPLTTFSAAPAWAVAMETRLSYQIADLRDELMNEIAILRADLMNEIANLRRDLSGDIASLGNRW